MRIRQLGALTDADLGTATQMVDMLSQQRLDLQRSLIEAQRAGTAVPDALAHSIMSLDAEWDALDTSIDSTTHASLPHWLASAQDLANEIASLRSQLNMATGASSTRTLATLVIGGLAALAVAGGLAYYVSKKTHSKNAPGLFGTPEQHRMTAEYLIQQSGHATRKDKKFLLARAQQELTWVPGPEGKRLSHRASMLRREMGR